MLNSANSVIGVSQARAKDASEVQDDYFSKAAEKAEAAQQEILAKLKASSARGVINEYYPTAMAMSRLQGNLAYQVEVFEVDSSGKRGKVIASFK